MQDVYYVKNMLIPYLSTVYYKLVSRQSNKDYLSALTTKHYLNLPDYIGERIVQQINANGDERIDHDEFVGFFVTVCMGSKLQKLKIAFEAYDHDRNGQISAEEVKHVSFHVPLRVENRYGVSNQVAESEVHMSKHLVVAARKAD